jgi:hypothetical protein
MKDGSRIKFNPVTKEIEIEGSEKFVKKYFDKIRKMLSEPQKALSIKAPVKERPIIEKVVKKGRPSKKALKVAKKMTVEKKVKKVSNAEKILTLVKESAEGITTAELNEKAGLTDKQIWAMVNVFKRQGKIKNAKRGVYVAA